MPRLTKALAAIILMTTVVCFAGCNKSENQDHDVCVTTYTPQDITQTSAVCGGDVIVTQGLSLNELGVCWSTERNPTARDSHLSTTNWSNTYVCTITGLEPSTEYHVRAYALRGLEYYYGDDKSFTTEENGGGWISHEWVDLGLPSGTLWAVCNIGANTPEDNGGYFAWGETNPKNIYSWDTYNYCNGGNGWNTLTKYCNDLYYGYNGFTDNLTVLLSEDDAATVNWGDDWRMPTLADFQELLDNTTSIWTTQNGVNGRLFTAINGNNLFLPAAGVRLDEFYSVGLRGFYWSTSLFEEHPIKALNFDFNPNSYYMGSDTRYWGGSVRAVRSAFP